MDLTDAKAHSVDAMTCDRADLGLAEVTIRAHEAISGLKGVPVLIVDAELTRLDDVVEKAARRAGWWE